MGQNIVDIKPSDVAFKTNDECGTWTKDRPVRGHVDGIPTGGGTWLVGAQVKPGRYAPSGDCLCERMRSFTWEYPAGPPVDAIAIISIASGTAGTVEIRSSDIGFSNDPGCGSWTRK